MRAWIETYARLRDSMNAGVARRVRAWIETVIAGSMMSGLPSPAACGRGLKQTAFDHAILAARSPAACGRGLKLPWIGTTLYAEVARRVRAWIETGSSIQNYNGLCRPPRAGVD